MVGNRIEGVLGKHGVGEVNDAKSSEQVRLKIKCLLRHGV